MIGRVAEGVAGPVVAYKALDIAKTNHPSRNKYALVALGLGTAASVLSGAAGGLAGNYGTNPLLAGGVAFGATAVGMHVLKPLSR